MGENAGIEAVIPEPEITTPVESAGNPAWNDFLAEIPASMHDMVRPHLEKWDAGVQQKIQAVHSEWADFKPFKDAGLNGEVLQQAYGIYEAINADPKRVYEVLAETYGFSPQQIAQVQQQGQPEIQQPGTGTAEYDITGGQPNPEILQLRQGFTTMAEYLVKQEQEKANAQADVELNNQLAAAKAKFGDFDETFVLGYMNTGVPLEKAIQGYQALANDILTKSNRPQAPTVISGAGPLPSNAIDPAKMNGTDTRALVATLIKAANDQGV